MNAPDREARTLVAFSGAPVAGGAGLKTPIYGGAEGDMSFTESGATLSSGELEQNAARGLVTLLERREVSALNRAVVLYAVPEFVKPADDSHALSHPELEWDDRAQCFVAHFARENAERCFEDWADQLLAYGRAQLGVEAGPGARIAARKRAKGAALRARYCTLGRASRPKRLEAFALLLAAVQRLGGDFEAVRLDAQLDFDDRGLAEIQRRAWELLRAPGSVPEPSTPPGFGPRAHFPRSRSALRGN